MSAWKVVKPMDQISIFDFLPTEDKPVEKRSLITEVLLRGTGFENGKRRVYEFFKREMDENKRAEFLKKEYGVGGYSTDYGFVSYKGSGIDFEYNEPLQIGQGRLSHAGWPMLVREIDELISNGEYMPEEKVEDPDVVKMPTKEELDKKYKIPRTYQKEERWTDDWHYTEIETPKESKIYYVICSTPQGNYNYTYMAWAYKHWWWFDSYQKKWHRCSAVRYENHIPFAWVEIPDLYLRTDSCLEERFESYIEPKLNEYFEDQDRRRMERRGGINE